MVERLIAAVYRVSPKQGVTYANDLTSNSKFVFRSQLAQTQNKLIYNSENELKFYRLNIKHNT